MIKKSVNQVFIKNPEKIKKLELNLNLRPQYLDFQTYYKITKEYENL